MGEAAPGGATRKVLLEISVPTLFELEMAQTGEWSDPYCIAGHKVVGPPVITRAMLVHSMTEDTFAELERLTEKAFKEVP